MDTIQPKEKHVTDNTPINTQQQPAPTMPLAQLPHDLIS